MVQAQDQEETVSLRDSACVYQKSCLNTVSKESCFMAGKKKNRRKWVWLVLLGLAIAGVFWAVGGSRKEKPVGVSVEVAARRDIQERVAANGQIQPVTQVVINPEVSGEIVDLPRKEGDPVKKGDLIVRIRPDNYLASIRSAEAGYRASLAGMDLAAANRKQAEQELARSEQLFDKNLVSDSTLLTAQTAFQVAKASYESSVHQSEQAQAALERAKEDLAKTEIHSPLTGTITSLKSQIGERVVGSITMAGTEIMTIADLHVMEARVDVGEIDVVLIEAGQRAELEVDAFRHRKFEGLVTDIGNSAKGSGSMQQEATRFEIKIRFQEQEAFRPGMSVSAQIETRFQPDAITVPIQSVTTRLPPEEEASPSDEGDAGGAKEAKTTPLRKPVEVVFVVEEGVARAVPVERGISDDTYVEIVRGLEEGQRVVTGDYQAINRQLEEGKSVRIE